MLTVFDPLCNGLRDPYGVAGEVLFTWRLGSDRIGAQQASYHVVIVSLTTGDIVWDSGVVESGDNWVRYGGASQDKGETCSWFVTVVDDTGMVAHSVPAAFVWGMPGDEASSDLGPQRLGFVWTSDQELNASIEENASLGLDDPLWTRELGVSVATDFVRVAPPTASRFSFMRGSLLLSRGLLLVFWERTDAGMRLAVSLPPGMTGELCLDTCRREVTSGQHELTCPC